MLDEYPCAADLARRDPASSGEALQRLGVNFEKPRRRFDIQRRRLRRRIWRCPCHVGRFRNNAVATWLSLYRDESVMTS